MSAPPVELLDDGERLPIPEELSSALGVVSRGIRESPQLRRGLKLTVVISLGVTVSSLVTPILVQQVFDEGLDPFRPTFVYTICAVAFGLVALTFGAARLAGRRLVRASEASLFDLRVRTFRHIHDLSIAEQSEEKRGVFVARVTADVDALQEFMEWGGIAWIMSATQAVRRARRDARAVVGADDRRGGPARAPAARDGIDAGQALGRLQPRSHAGGRDALGGQRVRDGRGGGPRVRARRADPREGPSRDRPALPRRGRRAPARRDALADVDDLLRGRAVGDHRARLVLRPRWELSIGQIAAFLFLADVFLHVFMDLPEIYSETQTAIAGWRKILAVLDLPVDVVEPDEGRSFRRERSPSASGTCGSGTGRGPRCCTGSPSRCRRGRTSRSSARPGRARRRS